MPLCGVDDEADKVTALRRRSDQLRKTRCPYLTCGHALGSRLFGVLVVRCVLLVGLYACWLSPRSGRRCCCARSFQLLISQQVAGSRVAAWSAATMASPSSMFEGVIPNACSCSASSSLRCGSWASHHRSACALVFSAVISDVRRKGVVHAGSALGHVPCWLSGMSKPMWSVWGSAPGSMWVTVTHIPSVLWRSPRVRGIWSPGRRSATVQTGHVRPAASTAVGVVVSFRGVVRVGHDWRPPRRR